MADLKTTAATILAVSLGGCVTTQRTSIQMTEAEWDRCVALVEEQVVAEGGSCGGSNCWTADGINSGVIVMERCGRMPRSAAEQVNSALMEKRYGDGE